LLGILIVSVVCMVLAIITMAVVVSGQGRMKKTLKELSDTIVVMQRQLETVNRQGNSGDAFLSEVKSAVSSAVANQMEYESKRLKQQLDAAPQIKAVEMQSTMVMPELPKEKAGTILCRSCYKPYPVTENRCPFCQTRHNK